MSVGGTALIAAVKCVCGGERGRGSVWVTLGVGVITWVRECVGQP